MRQDKFRIIDRKENGQVKLCEIITLSNIEMHQKKVTLVEIMDYNNELMLGDILLIEYNNFSAITYPKGRVIAKVHSELDDRSLREISKHNLKQTPTEEKEMQNHLVELLAKNFYTIGINFEHSSKSYTYKVPLETKLEVEDKVIVDTTSGLTIVNVVRVDEDASGIDLSLDVKYKFIIQKVDMTLYDELTEKDTKISKVIAEGAREKAKQELVEQYTGALSEDQLKALEECGVEAIKRLE